MRPKLRPGDSFPRAPQQKPRLSRNHQEALTLRAWKTHHGLEGIRRELQQPGAPVATQRVGAGLVRGSKKPELWRPGAGKGAGQGHPGYPSHVVQPAARGKEPFLEEVIWLWTGLPWPQDCCLEGHLCPPPGLPQGTVVPQGPLFNSTRRVTGRALSTHGPGPVPTTP